MQLTSFQNPQIRDANDNIIQDGAYGKYSALTNSQNTGCIDYINNNLMALYNDKANSGDIYKKSDVYTKTETDGRYLKLSGGTVNGEINNTVRYSKEPQSINLDSNAPRQLEDWALILGTPTTQSVNKGNIGQVGAYQMNGTQNYFFGVRVGNPRSMNLPTAETIASGVDNAGAGTGNQWNGIGMNYIYKSNTAFGWVNQSPVLTKTSPLYNRNHLVTVRNLEDDITYQDFILDGISYASGTIGSRGYQGSINAFLSGYRILSAEIVRWTADSINLIPLVFPYAESSLVYVNFYRANTNAISDKSITVRVWYKTL